MAGLDDGGFAEGVGGGRDGGVEVGGGGDAGGEAEALDGVGDLAGGGGGRAEDAVGAGHVQHEGEGGGGGGADFCAGGVGGGEDEQGDAGGGFLGERAWEQGEGGKDFELGLGHAVLDALGEGFSSGARDLLEGWLAIEDGHGGAGLGGAEAQAGLRGELRDVDGNVDGRGHARTAHAVLPFHWPGRWDCGGLRMGTTLRAGKRWRSSSAWKVMAVRTLPWDSNWPGCMRTASSALDRVQGCCESRRRVVRERSQAARKRNQVARGMRQAISGGVLPRSRTRRPKPPDWRRRSVARMAWSRADQAGLRGREWGLAAG